MKTLLYSCLVFVVMISCAKEGTTSNKSNSSELLASTSEQKSSNKLMVSDETVPEQKTTTKKLVEKVEVKPKGNLPKKPTANKEKTTAVKKKNASAKKSQAPKKKFKGASQLTFSRTKHNFGNLDQGEKVDVNFDFVNTGKSPLLISNVEATCGCTTPSFPFIPIAPGEKGTIGVTYNSTGKLGPQRPMLTVYTNDAKKVHKLYLEGMVMAELAKEQPVEKIEESLKEMVKDSIENN